MMRQVKNISEWNLVRMKKEYPSEGLTHTLWETSDEKFAIYFYRIGEYGMLKTCSSLQILKDKLTPQVIYDSLSVVFECNIYDWTFLENNWTDNGYLILRQLKFNPFGAPVILINLETLQFATWDKFYVTFFFNNKSISFEETFINKTDNSQSIVKENYNLDEIEWKPLKELTSKPMVNAQH